MSAKRFVVSSLVTAFLVLTGALLPSIALAQSASTTAPSVTGETYIGVPIGKSDLTWYCSATAPNYYYNYQSWVDLNIDYYATRDAMNSGTGSQHWVYCPQFYMAGSGPVNLFHEDYPAPTGLYWFLVARDYASTGAPTYDAFAVPKWRTVIKMTGPNGYNQTVYSAWVKDPYYASLGMFGWEVH